MSFQRHSRLLLKHFQTAQRGLALIVMLVILVLGTAALLVGSLSNSTIQIERDKQTARSLALAKDALIGYATSVNLFNGSDRLGDLPCPDTDNDGVAGSASSSPALKCNSQSQRIGRLPWKTLGIADVRDGSGERLWYAVSNNFKNNDRIGNLNSDSSGSISIFSTSGSQINNGADNSGAIAVIFAPNEPITRQDNVVQTRGTANLNTAINYLDNITIGGITQDNASFIDGSTLNGFIQGRIRDANGTTILNDQLMVITKAMLLPAMQKRVAAEVKLCLEDYASNNFGRYPWAASITDLGSTYNDKNDEYFGRIPDDLTNTDSDIDNGSQSDRWGTCSTHTNITPRAWWLNWREIVFYGLAKKFKPKDSNAPSFPDTCATSGNCLNINSASTPARFVVIVAGEKLMGPGTPNQTNRNSNKNNPFYFLEGGNENADQSGGYTFSQGLSSSTFNDLLIYQ